jgi:hypothetical protein
MLKSSLWIMIFCRKFELEIVLVIMFYLAQEEALVVSTDALTSMAKSIILLCRS